MTEVTVDGIKRTDVYHGDIPPRSYLLKQVHWYVCASCRHRWLGDEAGNYCPGCAAEIVHVIEGSGRE